MPHDSCPVEAYARSVVDGHTIAGRLVCLAAERHLRDLVDGPKRGLRYDHKAAQAAFDFFSFLRLPADGEIDGKHFNLEPFQKFKTGNIFGWKGPDGYRRFRTAYVEEGKGNGKSPWAGGIGLLGLAADGEAGAEIYSAATTAFQAGILFRDAKRMAESSPSLRSRLEIGLHNIAFLRTDSFFRPISSEHRQLSGPRPHMALIDEIHEHPTAVVVDKLRAGTKSRRQALLLEITNSGFDRTTVCWAHHEYSMKVLEGILEDDSWFAYVCQLDPCPKCRAEGQIQPVDNCLDCDQWTDEAVWPKANPGIDTILPRKYLREQVREAKGMPTKEGIVKRLNFCIWTQGMTRAIPMDAWDACANPALKLEDFRGKECFMGLDIGATSDFTALLLLFPHDDAEELEITEEIGDTEERKTTIVRRSYSIFPFFWLPERPVHRDERTQLIIDSWCAQGFVKTTPGEVVDYDEVKNDIVALNLLYPVVQIAVDRGFQGASIVTNLIKHFGEERVPAFAQGIISMNAPFRELLELLKLRRIHHAGHPVLRWMASNTVAEQRGGLIKPDKEASTEKIDGLTALTMGLGRALVTIPPPKPYKGKRLLIV